MNSRQDTGISSDAPKHPRKPQSAEVPSPNAFAPNNSNSPASRERVRSAKGEAWDGRGVYPSSDTVDSPTGPTIEEVSAVVVDCAYKLHAAAGPGLLESVYEVVLARMLEQRGLRVRRQAPIPILLLGLRFDEGFRADLIVHDMLLVELKSVENSAPVQAKQVLTYLRLLRMPLGLLINFGAATFKEGVKRIVNQHQDLAGSRLRVNQKAPCVE